VTDGADVDVLFDGHDSYFFLSSCRCSEHRWNLLVKRSSQAHKRENPLELAPEGAS